MTGRSELRISLHAQAGETKPVRTALGAFLGAIGIESVVRDDILTATGEALVNAVEHAYEGAPAGPVELFAHYEAAGKLSIDVCDGGRFIERENRPERGLGLRIMRAIAETVTIDTASGTAIRMVFKT
ncbi:MAG: ATP-binding protein [Candidatus Eremiobacteraeota bacterium]|nr:ATP-binding protein [Candidatus Eremiobacteraeota bacterium]